jgi:hypothetical protein
MSFMDIRSGTQFRSSLLIGLLTMCPHGTRLRSGLVGKFR